MAYYVEKDGEHISSCSGYYDSDDALQEAREAVDYDIADRLAKHLAKVRTEIIHRIPLEKREALTA